MRQTLGTRSQAYATSAKQPSPSVEMTATGVQNKRSRSDLLLSRLAAKKTVKRTTPKIVDSGDKTLNTANPVVFEGCCRKKDNGVPRMARGNPATALSNTLRDATVCLRNTRLSHFGSAGHRCCNISMALNDQPSRRLNAFLN